MKPIDTSRLQLLQHKILLQSQWGCNSLLQLLHLEGHSERSHRPSHCLLPQNHRIMGWKRPLRSSSPTIHHQVQPPRLESGKAPAQGRERVTKAGDGRNRFSQHYCWCSSTTLSIPLPLHSSPSNGEACAAESVSYTNS